MLRTYWSGAVCADTAGFVGIGGAVAVAGKADGNLDGNLDVELYKKAAHEAALATVSGTDRIRSDVDGPDHR